MYELSLAAALLLPIPRSIGYLTIAETNVNGSTLIEPRPSCHSPKHLMTPEVSMTVICALTVIIITRPLTLIILVFMLCMFYLMLELIKKTDTEKSNTHFYIRRMINNYSQVSNLSKINVKKQGSRGVIALNTIGSNVGNKSEENNMKNVDKSNDIKIKNCNGVSNLLVDNEQHKGDINVTLKTKGENNITEKNKNRIINKQQLKPNISKPLSGKKEMEELPQESRAIQLLIFDMTQSLLHDTREVIKMLEQDEGIMKNSTEAFASNLRDLGSSVKATNPEYTAFLEKQAEIYDELGHLQRRLQYELSPRVVTPLSGWLSTDFARMNAEMKRMYEKKTDYDFITAEIARNPRDAGLLLQQDLCHREYERQMEITKLELLRLSEIRNEHAKVLSQFALAWKECIADARRLFDQLDSTPSRMIGPG